MHAVVVVEEVVSRLSDQVGPASVINTSAREVSVHNSVCLVQKLLFVPLLAITSLPLLSTLVAEVGTAAAC